jgi:hypothetical protein
MPFAVMGLDVPCSRIPRWPTGNKSTGIDIMRWRSRRILSKVTGTDQSLPSIRFCEASYSSVNAGIDCRGCARVRLLSCSQLQVVQIAILAIWPGSDRWFQSRCLGILRLQIPTC